MPEGANEVANQQIGFIFKARDTRPVDLYWWAKGDKQGELKTGCDYKGFEKYSRVLGVHWGVKGSYDSMSGRIRGQREMLPLTIYKRLDASSPLLMNALCTNENIKETEFVYVDVPGHKTQGVAMTKIYIVQTFNGHFVDVEVGTTPEGQLIEKVELYAEKMLWRHVVDKTEAQDERVNRNA